MVASWRALLLGARWLVVAAVSLTVVIWASLAYQYDVVTDVVSDGLLNEVRVEVDLVAALVVEDADLIRLKRAVLPSNRRITVLLPDGTPVFDSQGDVRLMDNHNMRPEVVAARTSGIGTSRRYSDTLSRNMVYAAKMLPDQRVVRIAATLTVETGLEQRLLRPMAIAAVVVIVIAGIVITLHLWRDRTRVAELVAVARAFANGQFTRRAGLLGGDVMAHLGHELNAMGARLMDSQQALAHQRSLLDGALGALAEGVACVDRFDQVLYANPAYRQLASGGVGSGTEAIGKPYYEHLPVIEGEAPREFEHRRRQLRAMVIPVAGDVRVIVLHDLTELKHLEGARRDFIAAVSHELKTPLTSIAGFAETLLDGVIEEDPKTTREFVAKIAHHSDRLAELVRDVLTLSRLEQGAWEVRPEPTDLVALGHSLFDEASQVADRQQVKLELVGPETLPVVSDPELVRQLLGNLISNAIRYNRPGGTVWLRLIAGDEGTVRLEVQDTGIGIPLEHQERIFERFYRVDAHRSRQSGGTGLGLAIIRQLLDVLGGTITLRSDSNGTCFAVTIPARDPRTTHPVSSRMRVSM
jgi:two-component system, OmpR family, phosphate regulon sensor histidine kinase PhoR